MHLHYLQMSYTTASNPNGLANRHVISFHHEWLRNQTKNVISSAFSKHATKMGVNISERTTN
jgi:hypothetical protein